MLKNGKWPFFFLIILLSLFFIKCGGGSGGGSSGPPAGKITLAWDSEADPAVVGYRIYYGRVSRAVSGQYENSMDVGLPCSLSYGFPCVSPLLPREPIYRFWQLSLG